jgi:hypothetical protein
VGISFWPTFIELDICAHSLGTDTTVLWSFSLKSDNDGGGGQASSPSLTDPWGVDIQGVALVA